MKENIFLSFNEARQYIHNTTLKNTKEWKKWSKGELKGKEKRPNFIPSNPDVVYRFKGWKSWSDWIGTDKKIDYLKFEEAREYIRNLNLKNLGEWKKYYQNKIEGLTKPKNIPWNPKDVYKNEWISIRDWIGSDWMDFEEAREFVRNLNLSGQNEWRQYSKGELEGYKSKPQNIPSDPQRVYPDKWIDLGDWLGTERKRTGSSQNTEDTWLSYNEAKEFIHPLSLNGYSQWKAYISNSIQNLPQKPKNIPKAPNFVYKNDGWTGWDDWLGCTVNESNIILKTEPQNIKILLSSNINQEFLILKREYKQYIKIVELLNNLFNLKEKTSIIEINLDEETVNYIQNLLFSLNQNFNKLNQIEKAFIGLLFLIFIVNVIKEEISYSSIWSIIVNKLKDYNILSEKLIDNFFIGARYPNQDLIEAIEYACELFHLRNDFKNRGEHHYIRNSILLQIGLVERSLEHLKNWLSNYNLPIVVSELLDKEDENYSKEFSEGWRALRRYRDNIISDIKLKSILSQNIWFSHLNLENLLKLSKERGTTDTSMLIDDEVLPIFYLDKIKSDNMGLKFIINAQDLYTLNLSGFRYELYIDNQYSGLLIADFKKNLVLEKSIEIINPNYNQIDIQVKNEDLDIVFSETVVLFDFNEQIIIFDEDGNIYQNIFKKLNATKKYNILMDSDLDCNFNEEFQHDYFDGYSTLITNITKDNDCKISYDEEFLFELNFTKYIEKPEWIDKLVLYSKNDNSFTIGNEENFILQIFNMEEETPLQGLPSDTKIVKWNYRGGYLDAGEINNGYIKLTLYPEMITNPKHTLLIKYKGRAFKKVVSCNFFEKHSILRIFMIDKKNQIDEISNNTLLNFKDIEENKFYLSDFRRGEMLFLKNKSKFYQKIKSNRAFRLNEFDGFGEDIFISEYLFNSKLNKLFNYIDTGKWVYLKKNSFSNLFIKKELPSDAIFLILDKNSSWHKFTYGEIEPLMKENILELDYEISIGLMVFREEIIDSFYNSDFLDSFSDFRDDKIVKMLLLSNYPFLLKSKYTSFIRNYVFYKKEEFFRNFYKKKNEIDNIDIKLDFSKYTIFLEHICMEMDFGKEGSSLILKDAIINKTVDYFIETPIILFNLLKESESKILIGYFDNILSDIELIDERDNSFIDKTIINLFNSSTIKGVEKHNLKVAMHHINGKYYLREALRRI